MSWLCESFGANEYCSVEFKFNFHEEVSREDAKASLPYDTDRESGTVTVFDVLNGNYE